MKDGPRDYDHVSDDQLDMIETDRLLDAIGRRTRSFVFGMMAPESADLQKVKIRWSNRVWARGIVEEIRDQFRGGSRRT